jgi:alpha-galactosidase
MIRYFKPILCASLIFVHPLMAEGPVILTPPAPATPRVNGPNIFGARPGSPVLYSIPATGERPLEFSVENLPAGLKLDPATGRISGVLEKSGEYPMILHAKNSLGEGSKKFRIVVGEKISLTPPMGWNSWNSWAETVDEEKVLRSAKALVDTGLVNHGWTYVNIDDAWQGTRTGPDHAMQGNAKFPDMKRLCDTLHGMGLKAGLYSTPWITSYAGYPGGSSESADGTWAKNLPKETGRAIGGYSFAAADAKQWASWGFDYLKYDWDPMDAASAEEMSKALRASGRDIVFSMSNTAPFGQVETWQRWGNCWRTTGDIRDAWAAGPSHWEHSISEIGFNQDRWAPYAGPGHWNDPDMLVLGYVGWGPVLHPTKLTPDEQYTHISLWCMLAAPLLLGADLERLDPFTISLLSNDEVLSVNQDALGVQATRVATFGTVDIYRKALEDGSSAIGFFNRGDAEVKVDYDKFRYIEITTPQHVRDLWRQRDLPDLVKFPADKLRMTIPAHGVQLYKFTPFSGGK